MTSAASPRVVQRVPKPRHKCHAEAVHRPGWLVVTSYAVCTGRECLVNGDRSMHQVEVTSYSPLPYAIAVRGRCVTDGVAYRSEDGVERDEWAPSAIEINGSKRVRSALTREVKTRLVARCDGENETIEVNVSWRCLTYRGEGEMPPLRIQLDTVTAPAL